jgi:hypothetical protein
MILIRGECNVCIKVLINVVLQRIVKCVRVWNTKWYDLICMSDLMQYTRVHMILEICISSVPDRNVMSSL